MGFIKAGNYKASPSGATSLFAVAPIINAAINTGDASAFPLCRTLMNIAGGGASVVLTVYVGGGMTATNVQASRLTTNNFDFSGSKTARYVLYV